MVVIPKKEGYGHLLKWLIKLGDIVIINIFITFFYLIFRNISNGLGYLHLENSEIGEVILLTTLTYFIASSIIEEELASNIVFFDKLIQKTISFVSLYTLIYIVGVFLLDIVELSWVTWIVFYVCLCLVYSLWHIFLRIILKLYRKRGYNYKRVVIVGGGLNGINVYNELNSSVYGYKVLGYFDDNKQPLQSLPEYLGNTSAVESFCLTEKVDEIFCTLPGSEEAKILSLMNFAEKNLMRFYLVPEIYKYIRRKLVLRFLQSTPVVTIREEPLQSIHNRIIKRAFDIVFSSFIMITVFPLVYIIFGSIIKLTSAGPIFFKQKRTGLGGEIFNCYKFRSMSINEDANSKITVKSDPRVTKIGAFMRKTSIDELPQFINVLKGDMSVVGPRPHMLQQTDLYQKLIDKFMIRHLVKPGITGWAQISGYRGETDTIDKMEGRFKCDVWYIENWSFFLDIKIIFVTIIRLFQGEEDAY